MLWVLKRTISLRRFFLAPKTCAKKYGLENLYNFTLKIFCLSKPVIKVDLMNNLIILIWPWKINLCPKNTFKISFLHFPVKKILICIKIRKRAKIRNRYNQVPHLTHDTNGKVADSQLDITNESQEVSPFPAGNHKTTINRSARKHNKTHDRNSINDPQKKNRLGMISKNILLEGLTLFQ